MSLTATATAVPSSSLSIGPPRGQQRSKACPRPFVYFFLDFSNIAITASQIAADHGDSFFGRHRVRLHCRNLRHFVERGRIWKQGYAAAGLWEQDSAIKRRFEEAGIKLDICERGQNSGREQNVDERIQVEMYKLVDKSVERGTVVLATGDGNGWSDRRGFIQTLSILHDQGFQVEVMSWRDSFNRHLRAWAETNGRAIELDAFYQDLTFVERYRPASSPHLMNRKLARYLAA